MEERLKEHEDKKAKKIKGYKKKNVIYTTLYGIKSLDDISKQLYMESFLKKLLSGNQSLLCLTAQTAYTAHSIPSVFPYRCGDIYVLIFLWQKKKIFILHGMGK